MEELESSDNEFQFEVEDVPEDGDDLVLSDPNGVTNTGRFLHAWKITCDDLLVAFFLSFSPAVQAYVKKYMVMADMNAANYLIVKWLLPKNVVGDERDRLEANMILDFNNEFIKYFGLVFYSILFLTLMLFVRIFSKSYR